MKILYTFLLTGLLSMAAAQSDNSSIRYIAVSGSAEKEITPNIIVLSVQLSEYDKGGNKIVPIDEIDQNFIKAIEGSGLPDDKVVVAQVTSNAFNTKRKRKAFATKTYELTFSNQRELLAFTRRLNNIDVNYMYIKKLSHTDIGEMRLEVKKEALKAAQYKAKELVAVVDAELGVVLSIEEYEAGSPYAPQARFSNRALESASADMVADDIGFKKIKVRYEIKARFAIR